MYRNSILKLFVSAQTRILSIVSVLDSVENTRCLLLILNEETFQNDSARSANAQNKIKVSRLVYCEIVFKFSN